MKKKKQSLILVLALLLLLGGGLFLYRSGFFPGSNLSRRAAGVYPPVRSLFTPDFFPAPVPVSGTGSDSQQYQRRGRGCALWYLAFLLAHFWGSDGRLPPGLLAGPVLGRDFADRLVSRRLSDRYQDVIRAKTDIFLLLAFLFPFFPDDVLCILAGLTEIPFRRFALIALCARPWGLLFASALGGASLRLPLWAMAPIGLGGLALFLLGMKYGDRVEAEILRRLKRGG